MYSILSNLTLTTVNTVNSAPAPQRNFYLTCPQCNSFCMMDTSYFYQASITLTCECGYKKKLPLSKYLEQMNNNHKPLHNLCKKHRYQTYISFCLNCKSHLCKTCIESGIHQSHSVKALSLNQNYLLKTDLITISNTVENFRVNLDNILRKLGNNKTKQNAITKFYSNLLDIQSYLTQLYYCYETISNYYIQQTVHYKETKHIKDENTIMLSEESSLRMNSVLMYLFTYVNNYTKENDYTLKIINGNSENGFGEFYDPDTNQLVYRGYIKDEFPFGFGILYSPNAPMYIGECKGFKAHGYGRIFTKEKVLLYEGKFEDDLQVDFGVYYDEYGNKKYEADWKDNQINGIGIEYHENGALSYSGMMRNNKRVGYGTLYDQNGKIVIQGEFRNGRPDGYGMIFDEGGRIIYQGWIDISKMGLA